MAYDSLLALLAVFTPEASEPFFFPKKKKKSQFSNKIQ